MPRTRQTTKQTTPKTQEKTSGSSDALGVSQSDDELMDPLEDTQTRPPRKRALEEDDEPEQSGSGWTEPTSDQERRTQRTEALEGFGVGSGSRAPTDEKTSKRRQLFSVRGSGPSPLSSIAHVPPSLLISKVDPSHAGDHSPSMSNVNRTTSKEVGILGRGANKSSYDRSFGEDQVPTLQFDTDAYVDPQTQKRRSDLGSGAHTLYTSLREMHGVGEQDELSSLDEVLDSTARAYSPYNQRGEEDRERVRAPRVNVHAGSSSGPSLHHSKNGVDPYIAQQQINLWYRDPKFATGLSERHAQKQPKDETSK